ncbi:hypothetical protein FRB93_013182 [Tulasnella sp. JGI-2019a]|nr:hypothetical protein FRB93_013182 [Tulasnella sp. JGI-2019a]
MVAGVGKGSEVSSCRSKDSIVFYTLSQFLSKDPGQALLSSVTHRNLCLSETESNTSSDIETQRPSDVFKTVKRAFSFSRYGKIGWHLLGKLHRDLDDPRRPRIVRRTEKQQSSFVQGKKGKHFQGAE